MNIERLVPSIADVFAESSYRYHVLVVDDLSPDGTADAVRSMQQRYSWLLLITGQKAGLGAAYVRGISWALENLAPDVVFQMDADFSHKPEDLPRLLLEVERGADFVIGSRYAPGGKVPENWSVLRRMNSLVGNMVARYVAGLRPVRDCTAGFRAIRVSMLKTIDLKMIRVQGYGFLMALLHAAVRKNAKIVEVPVEFVDRNIGDSKLRIADIIGFIVGAVRLRITG